MKKKLLFLFCFALIASFAMSQTYTVSGTVTGADGKEAVTGAAVSLNPGGYGTISGKSGEFTINGVKQGNYTLKVDFIGFAAYT